MVLGFGYDSNNDDYKVLRIVQGVGLLDDSTNKAQVYSFNDNCWRCIEGIPYYLYYGYYHGNLVNEGLHYVVTQESHSERLFIARFDLRTECFSLIECPNFDGNLMSLFSSTFLLIELGECLEYGNKESWIKLLCISQPQTIGIRKCAKAVVYSKDGRRVLLEIDGLEYGWYDLESEIRDSHLEATNKLLQKEKTHKHLVDLYQASVKGKEKNAEANYVNEENAPCPTPNVSDFFMDNAEIGNDFIFGENNNA
ncbi:F-box protein CPR30-like [Chenopodium quinoa]|uniref:F-box protein CPR30-like n=1 Tax=Chenopodium quinoa TaxID=63459 RepID=UPI000B7806ED|nr:F-box protein CPR30-like [Chenopodium quinoa]